MAMKTMVVKSVDIFPKIANIARKTILRRIKNRCLAVGWYSQITFMRAVVLYIALLRAAATFPCQRYPQSVDTILLYSLITNTESCRPAGMGRPLSDVSVLVQCNGTGRSCIQCHVCVTRTHIHSLQSLSLSFCLSVCLYVCPRIGLSSQTHLMSVTYT